MPDNETPAVVTPDRVVDAPLDMGYDPAANIVLVSISPKFGPRVQVKIQGDSFIKNVAVIIQARAAYLEKQGAGPSLIIRPE